MGKGHTSFAAFRAVDLHRPTQAWHRDSRPAWSRRRRRAAFLGIILATLTLTGPTPSHAFWNDGCGKLRAAGMRFSNDARWTSNLKSQARAGFDDWNSFRFDGTPAVTYSTTEGPQYDMVWTDNLGSRKYAITNCWGVEHFMSFNIIYYTKFKSDALSLHGVATHEWGHGFGVNHSQDDSTDIDHASQSGEWLKRPSMSTCTIAVDGSRGNGSWLKTIDQDDAAAHENAMDWDVTSARSVTANSSFENFAARQWWEKSSGVSEFSASSGGSAGFRHVQVKTPGDSRIFSTARYQPLDENESDDSPRFRSYVSVRRASNLHLGGAFYNVKVRGVRYHNIDSGRCQFPRDFDAENKWNNLNDVFTHGGFVEHVFYCSPPAGYTSWHSCNDDVEGRPSGEAWDVRILLKARFQDAAGGRVVGHVDHLRAAAYDAQSALNLGQ